MDGEEACAYLLGRRYESLESEEFLQDVHMALFFSYRRGFSRILGTIQISDTGWGCSHRSAQMLLGRALLCLRESQERDADGEEEDEMDLSGSLRNTAPRARRASLGPSTLSSMRQSAPASAKQYMSRSRIDIIDCFADSPEAWFSIHNLTLTAARLTEKSAGDWLGPATASVALRACVNAHQPWGLRAYVAQDGGVIYRDGLPRDSPVLILVPLRLGLEGINPAYLSLLQAVLRCPLCVGIIGGRESSSFYFFGYEGDNVVMLDPHTTQSAYEAGSQPFPFDSFRGDPHQMHLLDMDPSLSVGFFCANAFEVDELQAYLAAETAHLPFTLSVLNGGPDTSRGSYLSATPTSLGDDWVAL